MFYYIPLVLTDRREKWAQNKHPDFSAVTSVCLKILQNQYLTLIWIIRSGCEWKVLILTYFSLRVVRRCSAVGLCDFSEWSLCFEAKHRISNSVTADDVFSRGIILLQSLSRHRAALLGHIIIQQLIEYLFTGENVQVSYSGFIVRFHFLCYCQSWKKTKLIDGLFTKKLNRAKYCFL